MKKLKPKIKLIILVVIFICCLSNPIFARYYEILENISAKATIAEPIIIVEGLQDMIKTEVTKENVIEEYNFVVKNYIQTENAKRISEVDFLYDIEIKNSDENFPVRYELYDIETGEELLNGNNKISRFRNFEKRRICKTI